MPLVEAASKKPVVVKPLLRVACCLTLPQCCASAVCRSQGLASSNSAIPLDRPGTTRSSLHLQGKRRAALWRAAAMRADLIPHQGPKLDFVTNHVSSRPPMYPETSELELLCERCLKFLRFHQDMCRRRATFCH